MSTSPTWVRRLLALAALAGAALVAQLPTAQLPTARADAPAWTWPLPAPHDVVHGFSPPAHDWLPGHRGVDLAGQPGEQVRAAGAGTVSFAGRVGTIPVVVVRHPDGLETTYEPVRASVRVGTAVPTGAVVGVLRAVGSHCAPAACLHWGLRRDATAGQPVYLDPLALVGRLRVRLLPLADGGPGSWLTPAVGGASVGSSAVAVGWAGLTRRRRRRRLPPGVVDLAQVRRRRERAG